MLKFSVLIIPIFAMFTVSATTLTYQVDLSQTPDLDHDTVVGVCGIPMVFRIDASADLASAIIKQTQSTDPNSVKIQTIESSKASVIGGAEPYTGDYRTRVSIANVAGGSYYPLGIFTRIEVTTYGSPAAPKAFTLETELLNYRSSAELAEGVACPKVYFKLK